MKVTPEPSVGITVKHPNTGGIIPLTPFAPAPRKQSVIEEGAATIGDRHATYGRPDENHERIAKIWSAVLDHEVTAEQVVLCMLGLKLARLSRGWHRDSGVDLVGYTGILESLAGR